MSKFTKAGMPQSAGARIAEGLAEAGLAIATAGFTAAVWLSIASVSIPADAPMAAAQAAQPQQWAQPAVQHVTLPTVMVVGHRELPGATPAVTTAQNTAAIPVTLQQ